MNYQQNTLSLAVNAADGSFLDVATGDRPALWRAHSLLIRLGIFLGDEMLDLTDYSSLIVTLSASAGAEVAEASQSTATIEGVPGVLNWTNGDAQHGVIQFTASSMDVNLGAEDSALHWLTIQGVSGEGQTVTFAAGEVTIKKAGSGFPQPPFDYVSLNEQTNLTGNTTIAPTSLLHTEVITFGGSAGTRIIVLSPAGMSEGAQVTVKAVLPATPGILVEFRNGSTTGTLLSSYTTDGSGADTVFNATFDGSAWFAMPYEASLQAALDSKAPINQPSFTGGITVQASAAPAYAPGKVFYDSASGSLCYYNDSSNVTVNLGRETITKVRNQTGATVQNGAAVYVSGATGQLPTITLAQANSATPSRVIGVVTEDIANNAEGYVTVMGEVHELNTSAFTDGATVYLSATTPGAWSNVAPSLPNFKVVVGTVQYAHAVHGILLVHPDVISVPSGDIQDSTATGRALLTATDAAAAKTTLGLATVATSGSASDLSAGTLAVARLPALTGGDATTTAGSGAITLGAVGTAGTYKSVTTDSKGRVTAGTNPTTLAGYGITDALAKASNLSDVASVATSRTNLDVYSKGEGVTISGPRQGLAFDGTASASLTLKAPTTDPFSYFVILKLPSAPSADLPLSSTGSSSFLLAVRSGTRRLNLATNGVSYGSANSNTDIPLGVPVLVGVTHAGQGGTTTYYLAGVADGTFTNSANYTGNGTNFLGNNSPAGTTIAPVGLWNRALSAAEVLAIAQTGVLPSTDFHPQVAGTALITGSDSDFSADSGFWSKTSATISGGVCAITSAGRISRNFGLKLGYRYRLQVTISAITGTLNFNNLNDAGYASWATTGTKVVEFTAAGVNYAILALVSTATATIDDITLIPIGLTCALDPNAEGYGSTWKDTSGNRADATLPASGVIWAVPAYPSYVKQFVQTADKTVANTTTETTLLTSGNGSLTIPANVLKAGSAIRLYAKGIVSTSGSPNSVWTTKIGTATAATTSSSPGASLTNAVFEMEALATVRTAGSTGTIVIDSMSYVASAATGNVTGRSARSGSLTFDTTTAKVIDLTYTWGTASTSNTITCEQAVIEVIP